MKTLAVIIFLLTYILLIALPNYRAYIALLSALIFVFTGILPMNKVFSTVDWNVILMIAGTMGIVSLFIESKMPALLADIILEKMPNVKWAIISLSLFAGIISAFVDNVATVLMVAPVALDIAKKLKISPVNSIIAIAVASNLQGAATLVGDTTSILLGGFANLNFLDFFFFKGKPGLFWVVQAGALASTFVLMYLFRGEKQPINKTERTKVHDYFPSFLLILMIVLLIVASFLPNMPSTINGIICVALFIVGIVKDIFTRKNTTVALNAVKEIDYFTILLLTGLFIVIGGITEAGVINDISKLFVKLSKDNLFVIYTLIVWASVLFSAFIDNIPYVATMLPVTASIASLLNIDPYILYFGLLTGATLGGNMTPIGASANIAALGILRKDGYEVSAKQFMKIGVPFTLAAVTVGYVMIWLIWA
ncbi:ArsB/NhaD family transporter [Paratissierella segnis]|uniref:TRAP transporter large permease subunit n=1 Tax=Paratissierella segnis TaxID=2763679 RepID=A0A926EUD5_9FIRM|nr:SLC13 family permease [Paratissierella segnis]MBC8587672.1 TRAP transporter large permease subunit [Paratissierella segnis]